MSDYDHYIVARTLKKLNDMNHHDMTAAKRAEYRAAIKDFKSFQVNQKGAFHCEANKS